MPYVASAYRRPNGLMIALQVLGGIDLVLSLVGTIAAITGLALASHLSAYDGNEWVGAIALILGLQALPRTAELIVRALWTRRLFGNLHLFQPCAVSTFWAAAGFFVPLVSLWMPGRMSRVLSRTGGQPSAGLGRLCLAWALTRWLTCFSGAFVSLFCFSTVLVAFLHVRGHWHAENSLIWESALSVAGLVSAALGLIITAWITRRQPMPDQIHQVEVFG